MKKIIKVIIYIMLFASFIGCNTERRKWSEVGDIIGEQGATLGQGLDDITGKRYNLKEKLSSTFHNTYTGAEKIVDDCLMNKYVGIIPTQANNGGVLGVPEAFINKEKKIYLITYTPEFDENGKIKNDENKKALLETTIKEITEKEYKEIKENNPGIEYSTDKILQTSKGLAAIQFTKDDVDKFEKGNSIQKVLINNLKNNNIK